MAILIFILLLVAAAIVLLAVGKAKYTDDQGRPATFSLRPIAAIVAVVAVLVFMFSSISVIGAGEVGVPVTFGHANDGLSSGVHFVLPWTSVHKISTRDQNYTMAAHPQEGQVQGDDSVAVNTKDQAVVNIDATVIHYISPSDARNLFVHVGSDWENKIVRPLIRSIIRNDGANYDAIDLPTKDRQLYEDQVREDIIKSLKPYGIQIRSVAIRNISLPERIQNAVNAKIEAQQQSVQQQFQLQVVQQQAQQKVAEAQGLAKAQTIIHETLTPEYLEYYYIQTMATLAHSQNTTYLFLPNNPANLPNFLLPQSTTAKP